MSLKTKIVFAKARMIIFFQDIYEEAKKLALAVVIVEFMLAGAYAYLEHTNYFDRFTPNVIYINSVRADIVTPAVQVSPAIQWKQAEFSAYNAEVGQTDSDPLTMASGKKVYEGAIACPRDIKLGSVIVVENMGEYTCEDRLNIRYTNNFDIFMHSHTDALKFGRKTINYYVK